MQAEKIVFFGCRSQWNNRSTRSVVDSVSNIGNKAQSENMRYDAKWTRKGFIGSRLKRSDQSICMRIQIQSPMPCRPQPHANHHFTMYSAFDDCFHTFDNTIHFRYPNSMKKSACVCTRVFACVCVCACFHTIFKSLRESIFSSGRSNITRTLVWFWLREWKRRWWQFIFRGTFVKRIRRIWFGVRRFVYKWRRRCSNTTNSGWWTLLHSATCHNHNWCIKIQNIKIWVS